jgi:hypothetical protein
MEWLRFKSARQTETEAAGGIGGLPRVLGDRLERLTAQLQTDPEDRRQG